MYATIFVQTFSVLAFLGSYTWPGRNTAELTSVFLQLFAENASERLALQLPKYPPQNLTHTYRSTQIQIWLPLSGPHPTVYRSNDSWSLHVFRTVYTQRFITWISRQGILLPALCTPQITWTHPAALRQLSANDSLPYIKFWTWQRTYSTCVPTHNHSDRQPNN
jgi:hypothetical protein